MRFVATFILPIETTDTSKAASDRSTAPLQTKRTPVLSLKKTLLAGAAEAEGTRAVFRHTSCSRYVIKTNCICRDTPEHRTALNLRCRRHKARAEATAGRFRWLPDLETP